jgi:SpoVK/Ycf46/Vps4 family AAA+-type ATPase
MAAIDRHRNGYAACDLRGFDMDAEDDKETPRIVRLHGPRRTRPTARARLAAAESGPEFELLRQALQLMHVFFKITSAEARQDIIDLAARCATDPDRR